jgi:hypothetical protein
MFCWDASSCAERFADHQYWMSSSNWAPTMAQGGIFNPDAGASAWGSANRIFLKYCSSDFWSGDVAASAATYEFNFRGARIVAATITDLLTTRGMGSGARLLFGGCSAGAIGAMNNLEAVASMVPAGIQVQGMLDAAALLDIAPTGWSWSSQLEPLQSLIAENVAFTNPVFPATCTDKYPGETWKCLIGQYRMPLITSVPFFINAPQFDEFELMYDTDNFAPATPAQLSFVEQFQTDTLALIASLPQGTGVYSPTCLVHCLSGQPIFQDLTVNGVSMASALSSWYFQGTATQVVSTCNGWPCTAQCGIIGNGYVNAGMPCNTGSSNGCEPIELATDPDGTVIEPPPMQTAPGWYPGAANDALVNTGVSVQAGGAPQQGQQQQQQQQQQQGQQQQQQQAPSTVSELEPTLTAGQQQELTQMLSTTQRLFSAAPVCCNGRAAH